MSDTKNFGLRIELLDEILGGIKKHGFEDLHKRLNQKLVDAGFRSVGEKTLYNDLKFLREEKGAPINKPTATNPGYFYTEKFSIKDLPLTDEEVGFLRSAIDILKQVYNFQILGDVEAIIQKLENRVNTAESNSGPSLIHFEKQGMTAGSEHFENLLDALNNKNVLKIEYQPFSQSVPKEIIIHPYLLKEYRNRWFLLGRINDDKRANIFALDRIKKIKPAGVGFLENNIFNPDTYFNHVIGVSIPHDSVPVDIEIKVSKEQSPYIMTKPIHQTQQILRKNKDGSIVVQLNLNLNYELKSTLLSYGPGLEVKKPEELRDQITELLSNTLSLYND